MNLGKKGSFSIYSKENIITRRDINDTIKTITEVIKSIVTLQ
jgi:hypothetical protein